MLFSGRKVAKIAKEMISHTEIAKELIAA